MVRQKLFLGFGTDVRFIAVDFEEVAFHPSFYICGAVGESGATCSGDSFS